MSIFIYGHWRCISWLCFSILLRYTGILTVWTNCYKARISTPAYAIWVERLPSLIHYQTAEESTSAAYSAFPLKHCDYEAEDSSHWNTFVWSSGGCECTGWELIHTSRCCCADEQTRTDKEALSSPKTSRINRSYKMGTQYWAVVYRFWCVWSV